MQFREIFGAAEWVGMKDAEYHGSVLYRSVFQLEKPCSAVLTIVGLGVFEAYLNGRAISADRYMPLNSDFAPRPDMLLYGDPAKPFGEETAHRLLCPRYDVSALCESGENVLAVLTGPGWFSSNDAWLPPFGRQRLCFILTLTYGDGSVRHVVSDGSVLVRPGFMTEGRLRTGESHDYRGYDDRWMLPGYLADGWSRCVILPPLETDYLYSDCPADRVIRKIRPTLLSCRDGVSIYDCGENISGTPVLICREPEGGAIHVRVSERLSTQGELEERHMHDQHLDAISDGTEREIRLHFTWLAFRYLEVRGMADLAEVQVIHADVPVHSSFDSDHDTLNWLYDAYIRTQLVNMHMGIPSDCPHIERCGYTGDGQLTADAAMTMLDARAFYRKWIGDISDCQDRLTGHVQYTAPYVRCGGGPGGWGCAIVEVPYLYYLHYGDLTPAAELYPQMLRYFDYLDAHSENGLVSSDRPGEWCLGDWCTPETIRIPMPYVNTYFYVRSLNRVLEIAAAAGRSADIPALEAKREYLLHRITEEYYDPETGNFADNEQGGNAFALDLGLGDARTYRNMAEHYRTSGCYDTGIFGTEIVTRLLFAHGDAEIATALLTGHTANGSFGHMQDLGCTTLMEFWGDYARSDNHPMFGAAVRCLFANILGIARTDNTPGWTRVTVSPQLVSQLNRVSGSVTLPAGRLSVAYRKSAGEVRFTVTVPQGVDVTFCACGVTKKLGVGENSILCPL